MSGCRAARVRWGTWLAIETFVDACCALGLLNTHRTRRPLVANPSLPLRTRNLHLHRTFKQTTGLSGFGPPGQADAPFPLGWGEVIPMCFLPGTAGYCWVVPGSARRLPTTALVPALVPALMLPVAWTFHCFLPSVLFAPMQPGLLLTHSLPTLCVRSQSKRGRARSLYCCPSPAGDTTNRHRWWVFVLQVPACGKRSTAISCATGQAGL